MSDDWLTTGETATMLGVSRQQVVDLCDRGEISCTRVGTHRRIHRSEAARVLKPGLTREQERSLWMHRALLGPLMLDPQGVLGTALENIERWKSKHRADGMSVHYLEQWEHIIGEGVDAVAEVFSGQDEAASELRQNSPFAGVISDSERRQALLSFREHWDEAHESAAAATA